jgi:tyrosine-protein kinase Etk/Wzc
VRQVPEIENLNRTVEGIDFEKLSAVFKKNTLWIIIIFIASNLAAYLTIRYTKDLFESESELKLEIKRDATELGIKNVIEDQNVNMISGEIEQIKSKLFITRLIDSLNIKISYFSLGNVLEYETYNSSPIRVTTLVVNPIHQNIPVFIDFIASDKFRLTIANKSFEGKWNEKIFLDNTELIISKTPVFVEDDKNDYYFIINSTDKLVSYISKNLVVEPLNFNASTIRISFKDHNAIKARDIVNKIDSLYIQYSNRQKNLANQQKIDWLNRELVQIENRIDSYDDYFENFILTNKSSDLEIELGKLISSINSLDSQRYFLNKKLLDLNSAIATLQQGNLTTANYISLPETINQQLLQLQKISQELEKVSLSYNENTFAFKQKENEFKAAKDMVFSHLNNLKKEWLTSLAELNKRKEMLEKEFMAMPDKNTEHSKNLRFYKLYEELYLTMIQSKAQFEITQAGSTPDFKILSHATLSYTPISPKKLLILGIGFIGGIVLNIFFIGFLYLVNNKIISLKELEQGTRVPILGAIPITHHVTETIFHVIDNPKSIISEAIRSLRTNLEFFTSSSASKVITFSSTISGEGKSFLAVNLGGVIALSRKKVVLVDLDMRKSKNEKYPAGSDSDKGMSTILIKKNAWQDCVIHTSLANFDFIPSGPHPPNPSELLASDDFTEFLNELKKQYDFIVIDTPPVGLVTDGIMAMKQSDISIYVFRANYSAKEYMHNFLRIVTLNKLKNVSAVLNAMPITSKGYQYGYYEDRTAIKRTWKKIFRFS